MTEDLKMTGDDYNIALLAFFITYILFEVPSNLVSCILSPTAGMDGLHCCRLTRSLQIIKRVRPSIYLASIMGLWGIATIGQGFVKNLRSLVACRLLVGLFEAAMFPGC